MSIENTRFPNGVTNVSDTNIFQAMGQLDPTEFYTYWDDFFSFTAGEWTVTETQAGATQALTAGVGGLLALTNSAADDDLNAIQRTFSLASFTAGKRAFFKTRFKVDDATQSDIAIGLQVIDTTPLDVTDGVYFLKADNATSISVICRKNATTGSTTAVVGNMANDTFVELAWYYDGISKLAYSLNGVTIGALDASSTYLPDTTVTASIAVQNGSAAARTLTVDYMFYAFER